MNQTGRSGQEIIRALRAEENIIDVLRLTRASLKELLSGLHGKIGRTFVARCNVAIPDSGFGVNLLHRPLGNFGGQLVG